MRKPIIKGCLFLVALMLSAIVSATGLGKFTLNSYLGQSLKAEIDLVAVKKEDISSLKISLASQEIFDLANVGYAPFLETLEFSIRNRSNGQFYVRITSSEPIIESSFNILIKLVWSSGHLIREYTVFLESPNEPLQPTLPEMQTTIDFSNATKAEQSAVNQLDSVDKSLINSEESVIQETLLGQVPAEEELSKSEIASELGDSIKLVESEFDVITYGPVKKGDTLFKIIREQTSYHVQLNQLLIALFRANPEAFLDNNMNKLKTGFILRIPDEREVATISSDVADKEVKIHTENWEAYRQKLAEDVTSISPSNDEPGHTSAGEITTIIDDNSTDMVHESPEGVLKLSKGAEEWNTEVKVKGDDEELLNIQERFNIIEENSIASDKTINEANERILQLEHAMEENKIAREKELNESNQRIIALEKSINELQQLLKLKNSTMAGVEAQSKRVLSVDLDSPPVIEDKLVQVVKTPDEMVEREEPFFAIKKWQLWIAIFLVTVGFLWTLKKSRQVNNSKISDTI